MREIKFRAKRKLNDDWAYGSYVKGSGEDFDFIVDEVDDYLQEASHVRVITRTVGQLTGLKDKSGKEIYEGDIIEIKHPYKSRTYKGPIEFYEGSFRAKGFYFTHQDNPVDFTESLQYCEVVGNIYESVHSK